MYIQSVQNEKIKKLAKLLNSKKARYQHKQFLVEGQHLVQEASKAGLVDQLFDQHNCSEAVLKKLSFSQSGSDIIALCHFPERPFQKGSVLALDHVQDPGNVGTLLRSAYAFGYDNVFLSEGCADLYSPKVVQSSQGAIFHLAIQQGKLLDNIPADAHVVAATLHHDSFSLSQYRFSEPHWLLLGNEGQGLQADLIQRANDKVEIESRFESLNVAVAGSLIMYHAKKGWR